MVILAFSKADIKVMFGMRNDYCIKKMNSFLLKMKECRMK
jgi:hypothetical protein